MEVRAPKAKQKIDEDGPLTAAASVAPWLARIEQPVVVTGGTGFVGSHLVQTLCDGGIIPTVLVRDPRRLGWIEGLELRVVAGTLEDPEALETLVHGAGTVFHLAGVVRAARRVDFERGNRDGSARLVAAMEKSAPGALLVHVSSLAAAGPSPHPEGIGPEVAAAPISHYGRSKLAAEAVVRNPGWPLRAVILRPPAIYGPRDTDVLEFFRMAAGGRMVRPAGERWLTVSYVADVVRALLAAAAGAHEGCLYHIGEPRPRPMDELLTTLAAAGGVQARILRLPPAVVTAAGAAAGLMRRLGWQGSAFTRDKARELNARHWSARTTDSLAVLGLGTTIDLAEGARITWQWYRQHGWLR